MEQPIKMTPLLTDLHMLRGLCYVPIVAYIMILLVIILSYLGFVELMSYEEIKQVMGLLCMPAISFWIVSLYLNIVDRDIKEVILSLPYKRLQFGLRRVARVFIVYTGIFYFVLLLVLKFAGKNIGIGEVVLPLVGMIFFTGLSFTAILVIKNEIFTYVVIGIIGTFEYVTRGGLTGWFYPFQWVLNRPYYSKIHIVILLINAGVLLLLGQWMSGKREYLI